ncbi:MAG: SGNH/GDSL hydrolase family protein [Dysgonomonas sp.]
MEEIKKKIISELPEATTIENLYTLGTDKNDNSVKVPINLLKGNKGDKGDAPFVGTNNNWWVGTADTGVPSVIAVSQETGQDTVKAPSLKLFTDENSLNLKITDLLPSDGAFKEFPADLTGNIVPSKVNNIWVNDVALSNVTGFVTKFSVNSSDTGNIIICTLVKSGSVFTIQKQATVSVTSIGIATYDVNLEINQGEYLGVIPSPSNISPKMFSSGQSGYWGATSSGSTFTHIPAGLICYSFVVRYGGGTGRLQEVSDFKAETVLDANKYTDEKFAKASITSKAGHLLYSYDMKNNSSDFINQGWSFDVNGATPTIIGLGGKLYINKQINIEIKIQRCIATLHNGTNLILYTEGKEESSLKTAVSVNVSNNTINIYEIFSGSTLPSIRSSKTVNFSIVSNRKYIIEMYRLARANGVSIIDTLTGKSDYLEVYPTQTIHGSDSEVYAGGLQYDQFGLFWNGGTAPIIHELSCGYFGVKTPLLYIVGDSITYGYGTNDTSLTYAHLIGALTGGNYVVSPRGGGKIGGVIEKIQTECTIIKPKYIMVTIGTNQIPTIAQLQQLIDAINAVGSIPIINCIPCRTNGEQMTTNNNILSMGVYSCRFDLATCVDPTAEILKADLALYVDNGGHPNIVGFQRMADRVRIDLPFLL